MSHSSIRPACRPFVNVEKVRSDSVGVGMVIAAAIVVRQCEVTAEEILGAAGVQSITDMRAIGCDDYDINQLRGVVKEMRRKRRLRQ